MLTAALSITGRHLTWEQRDRIHDAWEAEARGNCAFWRWLSQWPTMDIGSGGATG